MAIATYKTRAGAQGRPSMAERLALPAGRVGVSRAGVGTSTTRRPTWPDCTRL